MHIRIEVCCASPFRPGVQMHLRALLKSESAAEQSCYRVEHVRHSEHDCPFSYFYIPLLSYLRCVTERCSLSMSRYQMLGVHGWSNYTGVVTHCTFSIRAREMGVEVLCCTVPQRAAILINVNG